jgi:N-carbamoyl-L-amino-acid hydrolase
MRADDLRIDVRRLRREIDELARIGRNEDDLGIYRMAFTDADLEARAWFEQRLREAQLEVRRDGAANVIGRLEGDEDLPAVLVGSHLDTVPAGGPLDGALGVLVGLECLRRVREIELRHRRPLEVVAFSDEEGRFGGLFGSRAMCGELTPERIHAATDLDGISLSDAMAAHGLDAMHALHARRDPKSIHAYLELHIEQGPVLDRNGLTLGVVEQITGLIRWSVRLIGNADHAGTTPMTMRRDAFGGLAEFAGEISRILEEHGGEDSVATVGRVDLSPGAANTVPGQVEFSIDVRDTDAETLAQLADAMRRALSAIARRRDLMFEFDVISEVAPRPCDPEIVALIEETARRLELKPHRMPSGAGHDAQILSHITRTGMIFVPSKDGRSHSPAEWTHMADIEAGANVTLQTLLRLAGGGS